VEAGLTDGTVLPRAWQPGPVPEPNVSKVRAALGVLFPQAPGAGPGHRVRYLALQAVAGCAALVVLLLRIGGVPAWDSVYAEDQGEFLVDAVAHPWRLLVPFAGYEQLMPRLLGQLAAELPLPDAAVAFALAGAGVAALCALFIYHAMDGWIRSAWLRALVGASLILLPLAPMEIADNGVNSPWYALAALFFGLLWRPRGWAGMTAAALVAFAAASSEILALIYAPLVLLRLVALPRWREHAVTAGWLAGLLVQAPVVAESYAQHTQRLGKLATPGQALAFYVHNVALRAFGWRVSLHLTRVAGLNGATVVVCAILVAGFGWSLVTGSRAVRVFTAVALIMGFAEAVFAATVVPYVVHQYPLFDFEGGSRYSAMPIMAMTAAAAVAVDRAPRAFAAAAALACLLAIGWVTDYRYVTERMAWGRWGPEANHMLALCKRSTSGQVTRWTWGGGTIELPCSRLHS